MTMDQLIARQKGILNSLIARHNEYTTQINAAAQADNAALERQLRMDRAPVASDMEAARAKLDTYEAEKASDDETQRLMNTITPEVRTAGGGDYSATGNGASARTASDGPMFVRTDDLRPATVARGQRLADQEVAAAMISRAASRDQAVVGQHGDLGQMVRAMTTTGASAIVPTSWASDLIDRARNLSAVMLAGAQLVPMDAKTVQIGRLTGDPTAAFRAEGGATTASDATLDNVTLTASTMSALVVGTIEWFQDAGNAQAVIENAIAQAMATQIDLVALYGGIVAGAGTINLPNPNNPKGILATLNASAATSVLPSSGAAVNGTTQTATTFWNEILDTLYTPADNNEKPNALIWNSKAARMYSKAYDTTGQPLRAPSDITDLQRYVSNQIPSYTQGTMANVATDVFVGDFTQLLIGQRLDVTLQVLDQAYAVPNGSIGILATWRGDIGVARPRAFSVFKAIKGA